MPAELRSSAKRRRQEVHHSVPLRKSARLNPHLFEDLQVYVPQIKRRKCVEKRAKVTPASGAKKSRGLKIKLEIPDHSDDPEEDAQNIWDPIDAQSINIPFNLLNIKVCADEEQPFVSNDNISPLDESTNDFIAEGSRVNDLQKSEEEEHNASPSDDAATNSPKNYAATYSPGHSDATFRFGPTDAEISASDQVVTDNSTSDTVFDESSKSCQAFPEIPTSDQGITQIPVSDPVFAEISKSDQVFTEISTSDQVITQSPKSDQAFTKDPTSDQVFTEISTAGQVLTESPKSHQAFTESLISDQAIAETESLSSPKIDSNPSEAASGTVNAPKRGVSKKKKVISQPVQPPPPRPPITNASRNMLWKHIEEAIGSDCFEKHEVALLVIIQLFQKMPVELKDAPASLLNWLLAHAGIYYSCEYRNWMEKLYRQSWNISHPKFWETTVHPPVARNFLCSCISYTFLPLLSFSASNARRRFANETPTDMGIKMNQLLISTIRDKGIGKVASIEAGRKVWKSLVQPPPKLEAIGRRVTTIFKIIHRLSLSKENAFIMGKNGTLLRCIAVLLHCFWGNLREMALEVLSNVAEFMQLRYAINNPAMAIIYSVLQGNLLSRDRFILFRSVKILTRWVPPNASFPNPSSEFSFPQNFLHAWRHLAVPHYIPRLFQLLAVPDALLIIQVLTCMLQMSTYGRFPCQKLCIVPKAVKGLILLLFVEDSDFEKKPKMKKKTLTNSEFRDYLTHCPKGNTKRHSEVNSKTSDLRKNLFYSKILSLPIERFPKTKLQSNPTTSSQETNDSMKIKPPIISSNERNSNITDVLKDRKSQPTSIQLPKVSVRVNQPGSIQLPKAGVSLKRPATIQLQRSGKSGSKIHICFQNIGAKESKKFSNCFKSIKPVMAVTELNNLEFKRREDQFAKDYISNFYELDEVSRLEFQEMFKAYKQARLSMGKPCHIMCPCQFLKTVNLVFGKVFEKNERQIGGHRFLFLMGLRIKQRASIKMKNPQCEGLNAETKTMSSVFGRFMTSTTKAASTNRQKSMAPLRSSNSRRSGMTTYSLRSSTSNVPGTSASEAQTLPIIPGPDSQNFKRIRRVVKKQHIKYDMTIPKGNTGLRKKGYSKNNILSALTQPRKDDLSIPRASKDVATCEENPAEVTEFLKSLNQRFLNCRTHTAEKTKDPRGQRKEVTQSIFMLTAITLSNMARFSEISQRILQPFLSELTWVASREEPNSQNSRLMYSTVNELVTNICTP